MSIQDKHSHPARGPSALLSYRMSTLKSRTKGRQLSGHRQVEDTQVSRYFGSGNCSCHHCRFKRWALSYPDLAVTGCLERLSQQDCLVNQAAWAVESVDNHDARSLVNSLHYRLNRGGGLTHNITKPAATACHGIPYSTRNWEMLCGLLSFWCLKSDKRS